MERCGLCQHRLLYLNLRKVRDPDRGTGAAALLRCFASQDPERRPLAIPDNGLLAVFAPVGERLAQILAEAPVTNLNQQDAVVVAAADLFKLLRDCLDKLAADQPLVLVL